MIRRPPRSTLFPSRRSSDLVDMRGYPNPAQAMLPDFPASYHNKAGGLSFADGHAEIHRWRDRKSTRLNSSHLVISYAVFCLKKKKIKIIKCTKQLQPLIKKT